MQTNTNVFCDVIDDESCDHNNEEKIEKKTRRDINIYNVVKHIIF